MASTVRSSELNRGTTIAQSWSAMFISVGNQGFAMTGALPETSDMFVVMAVVLSLDRHLMKEGYAASANCTDRRALERRKHASKMNAALQEAPR
jgi:hypothetical protein